jgi:Mat/Ecp fimbriae outer membrane usher protein
LHCQFRLDPDSAVNEGDVLLIGDLRCTPDTLADTTIADDHAARQRS